MARVRDYAAEYARRQARAREAGFRSYYAKRVAGTAPGSEARRRASGHRGPREFEKALRSGRVLAAPIRGKYSDQIVADVVFDDGTRRTYILQRSAPDTPAGHRRQRVEVDRWRDWLDDAGLPDDVNISP